MIAERPKIERLRALRRWTFDPSIIWQGARFGVVGGIVSLVYLSTTTLLAGVVGLPFQIALVIGYGVALTVHFTLQRIWVWTQHEQFALSLREQATRYLILAGLQYGITAASTSVLPSVLGLSTEIVYLATVAVIVSTNFLVFRYRIFHDKATVGESASDRPTGRK